MTWTRIPDDWIERVDDVDLSRDAELLHIRALLECNRAGNDGLLKARALARILSGFENGPELVAELVEKWGWEPKEDGAHQVPWDEQEAAEAVQKRRENARERNRRYRNRGIEMATERLASQDASPNASQDAKNGKGQVTAHPTGKAKKRDASCDTSRDATTTLPVPSRPKDGLRDKGSQNPDSPAPGGAARPEPGPSGAGAPVDDDEPLRPRTPLAEIDLENFDLHDITKRTKFSFFETDDDGNAEGWTLLDITDELNAADESLYLRVLAKAAERVEQIGEGIERKLVSAGCKFSAVACSFDPGDCGSITVEGARIEEAAKITEIVNEALTEAGLFPVADE